MGEIFRKKSSGELELVGDFDGYYKTDPNPWGQMSYDKNERNHGYYLHSRALLLKHFMAHKVAGPGIEFGCGLGVVCGLLASELNYKMVGVDISPTAIEKAMELHRDVDFFVGDVLHLEPSALPLGSRLNGFAIMGQIFWYVMSDIDRAVLNMLSWIKPEGHFVFSQAFLKEQLYGRDIANGFSGALKLFTERYSDKMELVAAHYDALPALEHYDGFMLFRKKAKA